MQGSGAGTDGDCLAPPHALGAGALKLSDPRSVGEDAAAQGVDDSVDFQLRDVPAG